MHFFSFFLLTDIKIKTLGRILGKKSGRLGSSLSFSIDKMGRGLNMSSACGNSKFKVAFVDY